MSRGSDACYFLRTARLGFRRWSAKDIDLAVELWGDARVTRLFDGRGPLDRAQVRARLQCELAFDAEHGYQYWPVFLLEGGEHVGCCGVRPDDPEHASLELGVHLRPDYWGVGLASEACTRVIEHAFEVLGAASLVAGHHPDNDRSRRLLTKLGFVHTHDELFPPTGRIHLSYVLHPSKTGTTGSSSCSRPRRPKKSPTSPGCT